ncbi:ABC transporter ATP-binding protein [Streptomyces odontomachi]|uniref:ABC transporter ATP-binding protein n=1 Tax=Streptomyces odontomachi TaxID=2944940 RepID=UPI00210D60C2|nr:ABC transporter ATP-binding protein [Streptomyces sp. ODS25]
MTEPALQVQSVTRSFGADGQRIKALDSVSFDVRSGEIVALLGANGAGKTTLVKIASTLLLPTGGTVRVLGADVVEHTRQARRLVGVVFGGDRGLYTRISGRENLRFFGMLAGLPKALLRERVPAMLASVGLADAADRRVETYSRGMKQRLHIAIGLIADPRVLLLDEPTVGLDPIEADRLRDTVARLRSDGVAVLLTSHYLLDVERLADRVVMLDHGRLTADQPLAQFAERAGYAAVVAVRVRGELDDPGQLLPHGMSVDSLERTADGTELTLRLRSWDGGALTRIGELLKGRDLLDMQVRPARLEESFASSLDAPADASASASDVTA